MLTILRWISFLPGAFLAYFLITVLVAIGLSLFIPDEFERTSVAYPLLVPLTFLLTFLSGVIAPSKKVLISFIVSILIAVLGTIGALFYLVSVFLPEELFVPSKPPLSYTLWLLFLSLMPITYALFGTMAINQKYERGKTSKITATSMSSLFIGYCLLGLLYLGIHIYTIVFSFETAGILGAILTLLLPGIAEVYWFFTIAIESGTLLHPYCIVLLSAMYFQITFFILGSIGIEANESRELQSI